MTAGLYGEVYTEEIRKEHKMPTLVNDKVSELIKEIKDFLVNGFGRDVQNSRELVQYYWKVSQLADKLLMLTLGKAGMKFPVDVETLAIKLGICIEEEGWSEFAFDKTMNKKIGQVVISQDIFDDTIKKTIITDKSVALSAKRYAIAHEVVHCIMHYDKMDYYEAYCVMPLCPVDMEEIVADIFAIFLLIPVRLFFPEFVDYIQNHTIEEGEPVTTEQWMRYLAERSQVSEYYVAYGYQQLRYVAYWIYQAWYDEENDEVRIDEEERNEIKEKTKDYFDERTAELLFQ